jgi:hypothetical protein
VLSPPAAGKTVAIANHLIRAAISNTRTWPPSRKIHAAGDALGNRVRLIGSPGPRNDIAFAHELIEGFEAGGLDAFLTPPCGWRGKVDATGHPCAVGAPIPGSVWPQQEWAFAAWKAESRLSNVPFSLPGRVGLKT